MARERYKLDTRKAVKNLLAYFDSATPAQAEFGARWYQEARVQCQDMADMFGYSLDVCAAVTSHLSSRTRWSDNVEYAFHTLEFGSRPSGCLGANFARSQKAIVADLRGETMASSFGPNAHKTLAFYNAILAGGGNHVVIDVWMIRAIFQGADYAFRDGKRTEFESMIKWAGVYGQCAHAVRVAARRRGVSASTFQATVWVNISRAL